MKPVFKLMDTKQKAFLNVTLLSNSITLTPGTVSVDVFQKPYKIRIVALDQSLFDGCEEIDNKVNEVFCCEG